MRVENNEQNISSAFRGNLVYGEGEGKKKMKGLAAGKCEYSAFS